MLIPALPLLAATRPGSGHQGLYDVLVGIHVACAVIGFGAVAISGVYGAIGRRPATTAGAVGGSGSGAEAAERSRSEGEEAVRFFASPNRAEYLLVVAPLFGVAAMAVRPEGAEFAQTWAVVGFAVWLVASVLLLRVVRPAEAEIRARSAGTDPAAVPASTTRTPESRLMWVAGLCDVLFVVALLVMVIQPA